MEEIEKILAEGRLTSNQRRVIAKAIEVGGGGNLHQALTKGNQSNIGIELVDDLGLPTTYISVSSAGISIVDLTTGTGFTFNNQGQFQQNSGKGVVTLASQDEQEGAVNLLYPIKPGILALEKNYRVIQGFLRQLNNGLVEANVLTNEIDEEGFTIARISETVEGADVIRYNFHSEGDKFIPTHTSFYCQEVAINKSNVVNHKLLRRSVITSREATTSNKIPTFPVYDDGTLLVNNDINHDQLWEDVWFYFEIKVYDIVEGEPIK